MKFDLPDLIKTSVYEVIEESFEREKLQVFISRIFYIGDHFMETDDLIEVFKESIEFANARQSDGELTGLLLVYPRFFIHVVEGSEDTIYRHLKRVMEKRAQYEEEAAALIPEPVIEEEVPEEIIAEDEEPNFEDYLERLEHEQEAVETETKVEDYFAGVMFKRLKVLVVYHSITKRFFKGWNFKTAQPPTLVGKMDKFLPIADHIEHLRTVIAKMKSICQLIKEDETISFSGLSATDKRIEALPEYLLLDYILDSPHVLDLELYNYYHRTLDEYIYYFEKVWPIPASFTPRNLYKLKIDSNFVDPLPLQPWQMDEDQLLEGDEKEEDESEEDDDY